MGEGQRACGPQQPVFREGAGEWAVPAVGVLGLRPGAPAWDVDFGFGLFCFLCELTISQVLILLLH